VAEYSEPYDPRDHLTGTNALVSTLAAWLETLQR